MKEAGEEKEEEEQVKEEEGEGQPKNNEIFV